MNICRDCVYLKEKDLICSIDGNDTYLEFTCEYWDNKSTLKNGKRSIISRIANLVFKGVFLKMNKELCKNCKYFIPIDNTKYGRCRLDDETISPTYYCCDWEDNGTVDFEMIKSCYNTISSEIKSGKDLTKSQIKILRRDFKGLIEVLEFRGI